MSNEWSGWIPHFTFPSYHHPAPSSLQAPAFKISTLAWNLSTTCFSDMFSPNKPSNKHTALNGAQQKEKNVPGSIVSCLKNPCCNTFQVQNSIHQYPISLLSSNSLKLFQTSQIMNRLGFQVNHFVIIASIMTFE